MAPKNKSSTTVTPQVTITNSGTDILTSATISYGYDGVLNQTYPWTGSLAQYQTVTITLPAATLAGGNHTFDAEVINPNGSTDQNLANNTISSSFTTVVNGQTVALDLNIDCWGSETSWELLDAGNAVLYSGNGYADASAMLVEQDFCLDFGCYTFKLMDSYGDGLTNCNSGPGSYTITHSGDTLAELLEADADFGTEISKTFCLINDAGIAESTLASSVNVFPNPADEQLAIVSKGIELQKIELMNIAGQVIRTNTSNDMVVTMNVADVASGVYLVRIHTAQGSTTKQVVIK